MSERIFPNSVACLRFYHFLNHSLLMTMHSKLEIYKSEDQKNFVKLREIYGLTNDWVLTETPIEIENKNAKCI